MKDVLLETLEDFGYPVILQGTIAADDAFPDTFFTFRTMTSSTELSFDNAEALYSYDVNVAIFSRDPELVASLAEDSRAALKKAGFIPQGLGYDLISDEPDFSGWTTDYYFIKPEEGFKNG